MFLQHGIRLKRAESLNDEPTFLRALADITAAHLDSLALTGQGSSTTTVGPHVWAQGNTSRQMQLRCPGCVNPVCGEQKRFFADNTMGVGEDALR